MKRGDKVKLRDSDAYLKEMHKGVHPGVLYEVVQVTEDDGIKLDGIYNYVCASNFVIGQSYNKGDKVICILHHDAPEIREYKIYPNKIYKILAIVENEFKLGGVERLVPQKLFKSFIPVHNDFLGKPLKIGDEVVFHSQSYREYKKGVVKSFSDKTVVVSCSSCYQGQIRQSSEQLIKI